METVSTVEQGSATNSVLHMARHAMVAVRPNTFRHYAGQCRGNSKARGYKRIKGQCTRSSRMRSPTY